MLVFKNYINMKLTPEQFNYKSHYYKVWLPFLKSSRFHSTSWYYVDFRHYLDIASNSFICSSFDDLILNEYHDIYFYRIDLARYKHEYECCLNFLLSCTPSMLRVFAKKVYDLYHPLYYDCVDDVLKEIDDIIWCFKVH